MDEKLTTYITFRNRIRNLLYYGGITPYKSLIRPSRVIAIYGVFLLFVILTKYLFFCLANIKNLLSVTISLSLMFSYITIIMKMLICFIYREEFMELENTLSQKFEMELKKKENQPVLLEKIVVYTRFMYVVAMLLMVSLSGYTIVPLLKMIKKNKFTLFYRGSYPFPVVPGTPIFWMVFLFELSHAHFFWTVLNGVDNTFGLYSFQICGLFRLAARRILDIQPNSPNYKDQIRECVEIHELVLRAKNALQRAFGMVIIWIYITNSIVMCAVMWQANQLKHAMTLYKACHFICFISLKLLQSFTYAYYGSLVSHENDSYQDAIYMSNWPGSGNLPLMKGFLFILAQRTVTLKAGGFFLITMEMFEKVVNTTISYFFLLQTLDEK